jgi:zinc protease
MLFKGTPAFPQGELDRAVAREGGAFNGMTWIDFTTFYETLPADRIDLALRIESDRMVNAIFDPEETELERTVVLSEREGSENSPGFLIGEALQAAAFQAHPYRHAVIGWRADLEAITRDQLVNHYRTYYVPNNAVVGVAGDFEADEILARIDQLFGPIPRGPALPPLRVVEPPQRGERRVTVEGPGATSYLEVAYRAPNALDPDYMPAIILDTILGGAKAMSLWGGGAPNRSSRLYRALVETELAADVDCGISSTIDPFTFDFSATVRNGRKLAEVESALLAEIERVISEPVSEQELATAVKQTKAQFAYSSESVTDQAHWLGFSQIVADDAWFETFVERMAAVSVDDVQRVAAKYLQRNQRNVGWYVPTEETPRAGAE